MRITAGGLNRATLARQFLLRREALPVPEAVARAVALQAQFAPGPYLALWNRVAGFDAADLDAAFGDGTVVKSNQLRQTLHVTTPADFVTFRQATEPSVRADRFSDRFLVSGLPVAAAVALVPELLAFVAEPRTAAECEAWLAGRTGVDVRGPALERASPAGTGAWWGIRHYTPWLRAPTGGPWAFGERAAYVAPATLPVLGDDAAADLALRETARRYLAGFGPATVADLAQFALVQRGWARAALTAIAGELVRLEGPDGEELWDIPGAPLPPESTPAPPRLLGMWDNLLLAHADRDRVIPPAIRKDVIRTNGDVLPTLLVDGRVAGVWRTVPGGIEATAMAPLPEATWAELAIEARSLVGFLAPRDADPFRRYHRWWAKLPPGETRLLPGG